MHNSGNEVILTMLELNKISYSAESENGGEKEIIKELSLRVGDGTFLAITGPNGGGKSTTAKLIMGIEKPDSGSIIFDGKDITDMSVTDRANLGIGFAFQQPVRFKGIRIIDLLRIAAKRNLTVAEACTYLSEVGLCAKDYIDREVNASLSGGEMKRIEIAGIAAKNSKLSVFDEPEAGIDLWSFSNLIKVFRNEYSTSLTRSPFFRTEKFFTMASERTFSRKFREPPLRSTPAVLLLADNERSCCLKC